MTRKKCGRPPTISRGTVSKIVTGAQQNNQSSRKISKKYGVSKTSVLRLLHKNKLSYYRKGKKPNWNDEHIQNRKYFGITFKQECTILGKRMKKNSC